MPLRLFLRLLLAGLVTCSALLSPVPRLTDPGPMTRTGVINHAPTAYADGGDWPFLWKGWPMFGHDPAHTGYNPDETQLRPPLRLKWSYGCC